MEGLDAGGDDDIALIQTVGDDDRPRIESQQLDVAQRDGQLRRIDDPDRGLAIQFGQGGGGYCDTGILTMRPGNM